MKMAEDRGDVLRMPHSEQQSGSSVENKLMFVQKVIREQQ